MKIGTINIDWFKKSNNLKDNIRKNIVVQDLDILVVNENIESFYIDKNFFEYHSKPIPINKEFQHLDYGIYLKGEIPLRTSIYSKHKSIQKLATIDNYTSVSHKFIVDDIEFVLYGTIIGTWGVKHQIDIAKPELENFKKDVQNLLFEHQNVFIIGDLNTSFIEKEKRQLPGIKSRLELLEFTDKFKINRVTQELENCIDHIFISNNLSANFDFKTTTFLTNNQLKDDPHKGIVLEINLKL